MHITIVTGDKIPSIKYGGVQRVVWCLGKELHKRGHKVTFIAGKGSYCPFAEVVEINPDKDLKEQIPTNADIVHFNIPVPEGFTRPHLLTIHGNGIPQNADKNLVFVSQNQANRFGSQSFVYNGLDWDEYGQVDLTLSRKRFHFLGKAAWKVKNLRGAIAVTKQIPGGELDVLGGHRLNLKMGFRFTWSPRIHFHGMVDDRLKKIIMQQSKSAVFLMPGLLFGFMFVAAIKFRKSPFDLSTSHHAHQEMVMGITTEMSGANLAIINLGEYYEMVLMLGLFFLFFANKNWQSWIVAAVLCLVIFLLETLWDNVSARLKWKKVLYGCWTVTFVAGGVNLLILMLTH